MQVLILLTSKQRILNSNAGRRTDQAKPENNFVGAVHKFVQWRDKEGADI